MFNIRIRNRIYKKIVEYQSDKPRFEDFYDSYLKGQKIQNIAREVWDMQVRYIDDEGRTYYSSLANKWGTERLTEYKLDKDYRPRFFNRYVRSVIARKSNDRQWEVIMKIFATFLGIITGLVIYHLKGCNCP